MTAYDPLTDAGASEEFRRAVWVEIRKREPAAFDWKGGLQCRKLR